MNVGKMSKKGQLVIPKEIRDKFGILPGDVVIFKIEGNKVIIEKIQEKMSEILESSKPVENSLDFQRKIRDEWD